MSSSHRPHRQSSNLRSPDPKDKPGQIQRVAAWLCSRTPLSVPVLHPPSVAVARRFGCDEPELNSNPAPLRSWWLPLPLALVSPALALARCSCAIAGRPVARVGVQEMERAGLNRLDSCAPWCATPSSSRAISSRPSARGRWRAGRGRSLASSFSTAFSGIQPFRTAKRTMLLRVVSAPATVFSERCRARSASSSSHTS